MAKKLFIASLSLIFRRLMSLSPSKNWCFTSFATDKVPVFDPETMSYLVFQIEECPDTHRRHFQGYVQLAKKLRLTGLKKIFPDATAHYEKSRGTADEAANYCKKEESRVDGPWEYGVLTKERQRSDLKDVCQQVASGVPLSTIMEADPATYVRNYRGLEKLEAHFRKPRTWKTEVHILWGPTGVGKTRHVYDNYDRVYTKADPKWWCGYTDQETVLIDDVVWPTPGVSNFKLDEMDRRMVLQIFDRYDYMVPIKGGNVRFLAKRIFLTSNFDPMPWLESQPEVRRRVTSIKFVPQCSTDEQVILHCSSFLPRAGATCSLRLSPPLRLVIYVW